MLKLIAPGDLVVGEKYQVSLVQVLYPEVTVLSMSLEGWATVLPTEDHSTGIQFSHQLNAHTHIWHRIRPDRRQVILTLKDAMYKFRTRPL